MLAPLTRVSHAAGPVRSHSRNNAYRLCTTTPSALLRAELRQQQRSACSVQTSRWRHSAPIETTRLRAGTACTKHKQQSARQRQTEGLPAAVSREATQSSVEPEVNGAVVLHFMPEDVTTSAQPGDSIMDAAYAAGVIISSGCNSGSCGMCEMEVRKYCGGESDGAPLVVRTCIAAVPPGYHRLEIAQLDDPIWGTDGWDT